MTLQLPWLVFAFILILSTPLLNSKDPDDGRDMVDITINKGFPIEEHYITTEDGYILGTFRIPYGRNESINALNSGKPVVLLMHGLLDSSYTWVNNFANESLAFILADHGYDVWLGNNRGNTFSKRHQWLHTDTEAFWNFSFDQMARYDSPDTIEYILQFTHQSQLAYVGHSEGTIQMFAMPTVRPDVLSKLAFFGALAPVAYVYHQKSPVLELLALFDVGDIYELLGRKQFLPGVYVLHHIAPDLCNAVPQGCDEFLWVVCGPSKDINASRIQVYVSQTPADTSVRNMIHWSQGVKHDTFEMFDYETKEENEAHYGPDYAQPPQYNLSAVALNVGLYSGTTDWLADPEDVEKLRKELPVNATKQDVTVQGFDHLDFVWGMHAANYVYNEPNLLTQIRKYLGPGKYVPPSARKSATASVV
eukprot:CAMPEP_0202692744 /NCGR_PEP_ID=MMETSP1385-20130828/7052_1 /ASSEMBLY_ACC=CAM_ASM_000861 /TAXON_ID=933848 /ORGANISM="Elphidium margaritaceum" /LENGTH=419 /DNA_ID=CAMNT_0049348331 /DNA_START=18 /DNA_END=1277 /DNA_ORIENTATION=+